MEETGRLAVAVLHVLHNANAQAALEGEEGSAPAHLTALKLVDKAMAPAKKVGGLSVCVSCSLDRQPRFLDELAGPSKSVSRRPGAACAAARAVQHYPDSFHVHSLLDTELSSRQGKPLSLHCSSA